MFQLRKCITDEATHLIKADTRLRAPLCSIHHTFVSVFDAVTCVGSTVAFQLWPLWTKISSDSMNVLHVILKSLQFDIFFTKKAHFSLNISCKHHIWSQLVMLTLVSWDVHVAWVDYNTISTPWALDHKRSSISCPNRNKTPRRTETTNTVFTYH